MGQEVKCEARYGDKVSTGKALLETDELIFRGDFRLSIPLKNIRSLGAVGGVLNIMWPEGKAALVLGERAAKWADKIRNPRTLIDKLDVKPGMRVSLCGMRDAEFRAQLAARTSEISESKPAKDSDLIFLGVEAEEDLARVPKLEASLKRSGAVWIVYPKGRKEITENSVRQAGLQAVLVDVKVARFSDSHTALKFVIPVARR
jgi:hypothetical protein